MGNCGKSHKPSLDIQQPFRDGKDLRYVWPILISPGDRGMLLEIQKRSLGRQVSAMTPDPSHRFIHLRLDSGSD